MSVVNFIGDEPTRSNLRRKGIVTNRLWARTRAFHFHVPPWHGHQRWRQALLRRSCCAPRTHRRRKRTRQLGPKLSSRSVIGAPPDMKMSSRAGDARTPHVAGLEERDPAIALARPPTRPRRPETLRGVRPGRLHSRRGPQLRRRCLDTRTRMPPREQSGLVIVLAH